MPFIHPTKQLTVKIEENSSFLLESEKKDQHHQQNLQITYIVQHSLHSVLYAPPFELTCDQFVCAHDRHFRILEEEEIGRVSR